KTQRQPMLLELHPCQRLCERVGDHRISRHMVKLDIASFDGFSYEVIADVDVLRPPIMNWIYCHKDSALVINTKRRGWQVISELSQQSADPGNLARSIAQSRVFGLC
ncbi:unnamed protein product, partial [Mycena citricolor]